MVRAAILTIGDELTSGRVVNSNAAWIAETLRGAGIEAPLHVTCPDDVPTIVRYLGVCAEAAELVVTTGGLGPTDDDLTHEAVAAWAGLDRELDEGELEAIRQKFAFLGLAMPETNARQALLPKGCRVLPNPNGTAPGCIVESGGRLIVTLPGVPREMKAMLTDVVLPELAARLGLAGAMRIRVLKTFGYTESRLGAIVSEIPVPDPGLRVGYRPSFPEIHLSLTALAPDEATAAPWISTLEAELRRRLGARVFGVDDETFPGVVGGLLRERGLRLATAESCTGGLVSKLVTDVAGSSDYFERGFVTYTNRAKVELLGVPPETFADGGPGAVSEACVLAMARGARERSGADVAVSVSGIAGPGGGTPDKPVGTVWLGLATPEVESARLFTVPGTREWVRTLSAYLALDRLRRHLLGLPDDERWLDRARAR